MHSASRRHALLSVALLAALFAVQHLFALTLSIGDYRQARGGEDDRHYQGPSISDGPETIITQPTLSLVRRSLTSPTHKHVGLLQPLRSAFIGASESTSTRSLPLFLALVNTLFWAGIVAATVGLARALDRIHRSGIRKPDILAFIPVPFSLALLAVFASLFHVSPSTSPYLDSLLGLVLYGHIWLWLVFPLRFLAGRLLGIRRRPVPPFPVGATSFFLLQYSVIGLLFHSYFLTVAPPFSRLLYRSSSVLGQPSLLLVEWLSRRIAVTDVRDILSSVSTSELCLMVALSQTAFWLTVAAISLAIYRRRASIRATPGGA